jgi:membrane-bound ClpP family serine protease
LRNKIVDLVARDVDDLILQISGRDIAGKGRFDIDPAKRVWIASRCEPAS